MKPEVLTRKTENALSAVATSNPMYPILPLMLRNPVFKDELHFTRWWDSRRC